MTALRSFAALLGPMVLAACVPADRPAPALAAVSPPASWRDAPIGNVTIDPHWWTAFGDPELNRIVEAALARNTDVLTAISRVEEAEADVRLARAAMRPMLDGSLGAQRSRTLGDLGPAASTAIQPELQLSWQADLFGRLSAQRRAARLQYIATQADRDGVALSVAAAAAKTYIALVALDAQLLVSRETIVSRREALRIANDQAKVGYTSEYELTQAQSEYESVSQAIPRIEQAIRAQENALRTLVGELPGPVPRGTTLATMLLPAVPPTLPADLLRRRPDILAAELRVAASDQALVSRRREFLPQVALSASLGQLLVNGLNYDPVTVWSLGGSLLAPIFEGGRLRAQVDVAAAQRDQAAFSYRSTVLTAFQDVETALSGVTNDAAQITRLRNRRAILQRSVAMAKDRYQGGYASYLEQLDAQRNLYSTELDAITVRQDQLQNIVTLYQALGGGWTGEPGRREVETEH